jgi:hypothetical protein
MTMAQNKGSESGFQGTLMGHHDAAINTMNLLSGIFIPDMFMPTVTRFIAPSMYG